MNICNDENHYYGFRKIELDTVSQILANQLNVKTIETSANSDRYKYYVSKESFTYDFTMKDRFVSDNYDYTPVAYNYSEFELCATNEITKNCKQFRKLFGNWWECIVRSISNCSAGNWISIREYWWRL